MSESETKATAACVKCGLNNKNCGQKYCGDGRDKDNDHSWRPLCDYCEEVIDDDGVLKRLDNGKVVFNLDYDCWEAFGYPETVEDYLNYRKSSGSPQRETATDESETKDRPDENPYDNPEENEILHQARLKASLVPASPCPSCLNWSARFARQADELVAAQAEVKQLRLRLLSAAGDDLCRLSQDEIKAYTSGAVQIPPIEEFLPSCQRFHEQIAAGPGVLNGCLTLAQLIAENEKLLRAKEAAEQRIEALQARVETLKAQAIADVLFRDTLPKEFMDALGKSATEPVSPNHID
jgi:hypothetical protein